MSDHLLLFFPEALLLLLHTERENLTASRGQCQCVSLKFCQDTNLLKLVFHVEWEQWDHLHSNWESLPLILTIENLAAETCRQLNNRALPSLVFIRDSAISGWPLLSSEPFLCPWLKGTAAALQQLTSPPVTYRLFILGTMPPHPVSLSASLNRSYQSSVQAKPRPFQSCNYTVILLVQAKS